MQSPQGSPPEPLALPPATQRDTKATGATQLRLMLWKAWRLKKRQKRAMCLELLLPVGFFWLLAFLNTSLVVPQHETAHSQFLGTAGNNDWLSPMLGVQLLGGRVLFASEVDGAGAAQALQELCQTTYAAGMSPEGREGVARELELLLRSTLAAVNITKHQVGRNNSDAVEHPLCELYSDARPNGVVFKSEDDMVSFVTERAGRRNAQLEKLLCPSSGGDTPPELNETALPIARCIQSECSEEYSVCGRDPICAETLVCLSGCEKNASCALQCLLPKLNDLTNIITDTYTSLLACAARQRCWTPQDELRRKFQPGKNSSATWDDKNGFNPLCSLSHAILDQYTGVVLTGSSPHWEFTIRANRTQLDSGGSIGMSSLTASLPHTSTITHPFQAGLGNGWQGYAVSGVIWLQSTLNSHIITSAGGYGANATGHYAAFPTPAYVVNRFVLVLFPVSGSTFAGFLLQCFFVVSIGQLTKGVVLEKERRIREGLAMMGLESCVYWLHWVIVYVVIYVLMTILLSLVCSWGLFTYSSTLLLMVFFLMYLLTLLSFSLLISVFFMRANVASTMSMILNLSLFFVTKFQTDSKSINVLTALLSPVAFSQGLGVIGAAEGGQVGLTFGNISNPTGVAGALTLSEAMIMLAVDAVLYMLLALYLDQVIPQEFGTVRHPLFICLPSYWSKAERSAQSKYEALHDDSSGEPTPRNSFDDREGMEMTEMNPVAALSSPRGDIEQASLSLEDSCVGIALQRLRKEYSTADGEVRVAVDGLNLEFLEGQISVILGHNGSVPPDLLYG